VFVVSGDIKDLGRILRVNRAVDQLIGYTPEELKGSKINKIMPYLYSVIHDDFMQSFLKRGASNFIDNNQFVPVLNKLGFIILGQVFVKA
jgi:PAS domain S-box-containing protein